MPTVGMKERKKTTIKTKNFRYLFDPSKFCVLFYRKVIVFSDFLSKM